MDMGKGVKKEVDNRNIISEGNNKKREKDINKIKNHTANAITVIHGITFATYYIVEMILDYFVAEYLPVGIWGEVIRLVFAAGGYFVLYHAIKGLHTLKLKLTDSKFDVSGNWYHVHIPINIDGTYDYSREYLSAGTTVVGRDLNDFTFMGDNYDFYVDSEGMVNTLGEDGRHTEWYTETSEIVESGGTIDIVEVYNAKTGIQGHAQITACPVCKSRFEAPRDVVEAPQERYGIHKYRIFKAEKRMVCYYTDCWPSLKSGKLYLYRDLETRNAKVQEYFRNKNKLNG